MLGAPIARHPWSWPIAEILQTAVFRQIVLYFVAFVAMILLLFGIIYRQAELYEVGEVDRFLEARLATLNSKRVDDILQVFIQDRSPSDAHPILLGLFTPGLTPLLGELPRFPERLSVDGHAHIVTTTGHSAQSWPGLYAAAARLPDGRILVIERDLRPLSELRHAVLFALLLGIPPALALSVFVGLVLGYRTLYRARLFHRTIDRIMRGDLHDRLPTSRDGDDFDRLADSINRMLDLMESLLVQIQGVGDDIAHDLRTPLTRVRTRLERGLRLSQTRDQLDETVDAAIRGLDQAIAITTALLRITELEDGRRRAAFATVDLAILANDLVELYQPIAELRRIGLNLDGREASPIWGDRDLLMEALSNLVDNALKFTPPDGRVTISTFWRDGAPTIRVADTGPGIPPEEREAVMRRFYRSDKSRHLPGSGLGLGLVSAITKLHGFEIKINGGTGGCAFEIRCPIVPRRSLN